MSILFISYWKSYRKYPKAVSYTHLIRELRNDCCHGTSFKHNQEQKLRKLLFDDEVFKNLKVGKKIAENMKKSIK